MKSKGTVYLVGAGPGDPELLTLRGAELLRRADVIIYDFLVNPAILRFARPEAEIISRGKRTVTPQEQINQMMISHARKGKIVVRLKGGDPFVFGRGGEEAEALAGGENSLLKLCPAFLRLWPRRIMPAFRSRTAIFAPASPFSPAMKILPTAKPICATNKSPKSPAPKSS